MVGGSRSQRLRRGVGDGWEERVEGVGEGKQVACMVPL